MARLEFTRNEFEDLFDGNEAGEAEVQQLFELLQDARAGSQSNEGLRQTNLLMNGHGVEAIRQEGAYVDNYHGDIIATYVNTGDAYSLTLLLDSETGAFHLTSYGDWLEQWEQAHPREDVCVQCGDQFSVDELSYTGEGDGGVCPTCNRMHFWTPDEKSPLIAMLRSVEGFPLAVHLWEMVGTYGATKGELVLGFSVPAPIPGNFWASNQTDIRRNKSPRHRMPWVITLPKLQERMRRAEPQVMAIAGGKDVTMERGQYERLMVALDYFLEGHPKEEFLTTPPPLWTCDQLQCDWHQERGDAAIGVRIRGLGYWVWDVRDDALQELIDDGFIKWGNDASVREYLHNIGICR